MSNVHLPKIMADDQPRGDVSGLSGILETQERLPCEWRDGNEAPLGSGVANLAQKSGNGGNMDT